MGLKNAPRCGIRVAATRPDGADAVKQGSAAKLPMQPSMFNLRVPLPDRDEVFLMNTLTDAQLVVSSDVAALLDRLRTDESARPLGNEEREALALLSENGFLVENRTADRQNLDDYLTSVKSNTGELNVTVLTTLQCNFACDYCFQGDHGDYNKHADKMSPDMADRVATWIERELDRVSPEKLVVTFFGGEPLLNLPAMYTLAERAWRATQERGVEIYINIITNGLLLTGDVVDRMVPLGLNAVKITLDGDRDTHNRMRPLRGGQGTFDRIVENIRRVAGRCRIAIGGNLDESSVESYPALLELLKPLNATCMTSVGSGAGSACDNCDFLDDQTSYLREETKRHGFPTHDGVHNGPCHVHMQHAHTIGPDGSLYACPGFTGQLATSVGHIDQRTDAIRETAREKFLRLSPWKECGDCAFIPVCAGGCVANSYSQLGDMNVPTCHKRSFESALISLAHSAASAA